MRPTAALFPIALLAGAFAGGGSWDFVLLVFLLYYTAQLLGLCAADSFRNAAACEPGVRRVDKRFGGALSCALFASAVMLLFALLLRSNSADGMDHAALLRRMILRATISAILINIEHLFEERMFALGRRVDGVALSCIGNGILLAGALIDAETNAAGAIFALAAGLGAALAIATGYAIEPPHAFSLRPVNIPFFPRACLQTLLYPALACALALLSAGGDGAKLDATVPALLFGLIPWRLARTTARRSADESRPLNLLLIAFAAVPPILAGWLPAARPFASMGALALICGAAAFCAPGKRLYIGIALTVAACLPISYPLYLNAVFALAAVLVNVRRAFLRRKRGAA